MSDYTPGHALNDILAAFGQPAEKRAQLDELTQATTRLYKAGQANERAAIVTELRAHADRYDAEFGLTGGSTTDTASGYRRAAHLIERGELS
jgi:hypothetical protein